jgi:hypothetical protein
MRSRKTSGSWRLALLCNVVVLAAYAGADDVSKAIEAVRSKTAPCADCLLFAVPIQSELTQRFLRHHRAYAVSTLDRLPPPKWIAVVPGTGDADLLEARQLDGWNRVFGAEKLNLSTDEDLGALARLFVELAVPRGTFLAQLTDAETAGVKAKGEAAPSTATRIVRTKGRFGLSFYSKDANGRLQRWTMIVEPTGQILKSDVREF